MKVTGYMCQIDWDHELGHASDGNTVYPSLKSLKAHHEMWKECGVVEVEVKFRSVVVHGKRTGYPHPPQ